MDSSGWKSYSKMDPELEAMLPHLPPSIKTRSYADFPDVPTLRQTIMTEIMEAVSSGMFKLPDWTGVAKSELQIPTRDGATLRAVQYRPEKGASGPLIVYYHGGGFSIGMAEQWDSSVEMLTKELGAAVVAVEYRKAPEKVFPTAHHDAWDALKWIAENASTLVLDTGVGFIVAGCSAGGSLAAAVSHQAIDEGLCLPLTGVILTTPNLIHQQALPEQYKAHHHSWEQNKDAIVLDQKGMNWFLDQYKPDVQSPLLSPLIWPSGHTKQPPTYFEVSGMDPVRDDALLYEAILRENGVPTKMTILSGLPHAALDFFPMLTQVKQAKENLKEAVKWMIAQQKAAASI